MDGLLRFVRSPAFGNQIQPLSWAERTACARLAAPVFPIAEESTLRTVPGDRKTSSAMRPAVRPSAARRSTWRSRSLRGFAPSNKLCSAREGSRTRSPACTRRTASASCSAGASLATNPAAPASSADRRYPGRANVDPFRRLDAVHPRHLDVHQADVRSQFGGETHGVRAVGPGAENGHVTFELQQRRHGAADQRLVVHQKQTDRVGAHQVTST